MTDDPQRRETDTVSTKDKAVDRSLVTATLGFAIAFLYQMSEVLKTHTCFCDFVKPAGVGEIVFALVCGLLAIAFALGVDVTRFVKGFSNQKE